MAPMTTNDWQDNLKVARKSRLEGLSYVPGLQIQVSLAARNEITERKQTPQSEFFHVIIANMDLREMWIQQS